MAAAALAATLMLGAVTAAAGGDPFGDEPVQVMARLVEEPLDMLALEDELPPALPVMSGTDSSVPARSAIMIDQHHGTVLYEKNPDEPLPPASITKVMTLLLAMEALESGRIRLDEMVSPTEYACSMGGSQIWLKPDEQMSVEDLLKAIAISSANDASVAIGEKIAGTNDAFIDMMNSRAHDLGMNNTHFLNATGLDEPGHLTTARDIAVMSRALMKHALIKEYSTIWMDSLRGGATELVNTNRLVRFYGGATGLKTGTTNGAGSCLSATAERDGLALVAVVMGSPTSDERFAAARSLLDFGFANYTTVEPPPIHDQLTPVRVIRGVDGGVAVTYDPPEKFVVSKAAKENITQNITLVDDVEAPVYKGQVLGKTEVIVDGALVASYDLRAADQVGRITVFKAFGKLMGGLVRLDRN
ncbi:MAG: D-alanyl-D-alanine carboxypeptidase [Oscillospiraceae bacterium]|nr:D-alanyl-D-alanine carboxypeptidase [Oscillospiraceae bacterium]